MIFQCDSKYLIFPVGHHAQKKSLAFYHEDKLVYDLEIELDYVQPDYEVYIDMERFAGLQLKAVCTPGIELFIQKSAAGCNDEQLYKEKFRPGFHFSAKRGWLNDPNGLVWHEGRYHLFYQHNPAGCMWGNMHWGHAVSRDFIHWEERDIALFPDELGTMFSGCAVVDEDNRAGLQTGGQKTILLYYTAAGGTSLLSKNHPYTQCLAYSTDGGNCFVKYDRNPIIGHIAKDNRDPKVVYHKESGRYVMSLYLDGNQYALFVSENLLDWTLIQNIDLCDDAECPDFYPLQVDGDPNNIQWVLSGAADRYLIGSFDGRKFESHTEVRRLHYGKNSYASQTFYCLADGDSRRVRLAWNTFHLAGMPFDRSMTTPCEMRLKTIGNEVFLCALPVVEMEKLLSGTRTFSHLPVQPGQCHQVEVKETLVDISLEVACGEEAEFHISLFGVYIQCDMLNGQISCIGEMAPIIGEADRIKLRMLIDRTGVELYVNEGEVYFSTGLLIDYNLNRLEIKATSKVIIEELRISEMNSIW